MSRLLLVEDDSSLGATLMERLKKEGHHVTWAQSIAEGEKAIADHRFDVAILDVGLPDGSGFELAKGITATPFIFMTAQSDAENRLEGFEIGAEEFIPKPFHLKELLLRVKHVLQNHVKPEVVKAGEFSIDFGQFIVTTPSGEKQALSAKEAGVLQLLIERSPQVMSREQILDLVWGEDQFPSNRTIDNLIVRLRQVFNDKSGELIRSVRGVGYQWLRGEEENG